MLYFIIVLLIIAIALLLKIALGTRASQDSRELREQLAFVRDQNSVQKELLEMLNQQNHQMHQTIDAKLAQTHQANQEQMGQTQRLIHNMSAQSLETITKVTAKLTQLDETNRQVVNFSSQLQNLQDILKNPKQRGILGEYFLEETLKNVLPPNSYQMQYKFQNGEIVDAVIFVKEQIIPVDSKFSLENYERLMNKTNSPELREKLARDFKNDIKKRIEETGKYVRPAENTMDFAFMFIPSEAIYYDLLTSKVAAEEASSRNLIEYAFAQHVIIVSPTSFLAYLQTVLQGLRALKIEESTKEIRNNVEKLGRHLATYDEFLKKVGTSINATVNHYNNAYKEFKKVDKDVAKITGTQSELEPMLLDKTTLD
jgi:DNA recombination protein RmuC